MRLLPAVTLLVALLFGPAAHAIPGDSDAKFGGYVNDFILGGFSAERATALAWQPDGRIVVAGELEGRLLVARYSGNGVLDPSFGQGGYRSPPGLGPAVAVALRPGGDLVLGTNHPTGITMLRLSGDGLWTRATGTTLKADAIVAMAPDPDGKSYLVAGTTAGAEPDALLMRIGGDSLEPDAAFGVGGRVTPGFGASGPVVTALAIQPDGRILAAGPGPAGTFFLARFRSNGDLDASFARGGRAFAPFAIAAGDRVNAIAIQPTDGLIVVALEGRSTLVRFRPDGSLDTSFAGTGRISDVIGAGGGSARSVIPVADRRLLVAGNTARGGFALARVNRDGTIDRSFGDQGRTLPVVPAGDLAQAVATTDQHLVAVGARRAGGSETDLVAVRFTLDGAPDRGFGKSGVGVVDLAARHSSEGRRVAVRAGGGVVVGGMARVGAETAISLVGLDAYGNRDASFADNGVAMTVVPGLEPVVEGLLRVPGDRLLAIAPMFSSGLGRALAIARYDARGRLDPAWANGGPLVIPEPCTAATGATDPEDCRVAASLRPDGSLLVATVSYAEDADAGDVVVYQVTPQGAIDARFGVGGRVRVADPRSDLPLSIAVAPDGQVALRLARGAPGDATRQVVLVTLAPEGAVGTTMPTPVSMRGIRALQQPDGRVIFAGVANDQLVVARLEGDGTVDDTFGTGPATVITTGLSGRDYRVADVVRQSDGRFYIVGDAAFLNVRALFVARLAVNGRLDPRYGTRGVAKVSRAEYPVVAGATLDPQRRLVISGFSRPDVDRDDSMRAWRLQGGDRPTGDLDADGRGDLVWIEGLLGRVSAYLMDEGVSYREVELGSSPALRTSLPFFFADLDGDWIPEILPVAMPESLGNGFHVSHAGDLDGDGSADLAWYESGGPIRLTLMQGTTVRETVDFDWPGWSMVAMADLDGDGFADLVLAHENGMVMGILMRGLAPQAAGLLLGPSSGWSVALVADIDGDGKADLVLRGTDYTVIALRMDGLAPVGGALVAGPGERFAPFIAARLTPEDGLWIAGTRGNASGYPMRALKVGFDGAAVRVADVSEALPAMFRGYARDLTGSGIEDLVVQSSIFGTYRLRMNAGGGLDATLVRVIPNAYSIP